MFAVGNIAVLAATNPENWERWLALAYVGARLPLLAMYWRVRRSIPSTRRVTDHFLRFFGVSAGLWLLSVAAVSLGYTLELGEKSPEEALHFIQYGVLGVLVYRALAHRRHDTSIYIAAALICGILGIIDEVIQWLTPRRYWSLRDIWINFFGLWSNMEKN